MTWGGQLVCVENGSTQFVILYFGAMHAWRLGR